MKAYNFLRDLFVRTYKIRKQINQDFKELSLLFNEEIKNFKELIEKEEQKILYLERGFKAYNQNLEQANIFIKKIIPELIVQQLNFISNEFKFFEQNDFLIKRLSNEEMKYVSDIFEKYLSMHLEDLKIGIKYIDEGSDIVAIFRKAESEFRNRLNQIQNNLKKQMENFEQIPYEYYILTKNKTIGEIIRDKDRLDRLLIQLKEELRFLKETENHFEVIIQELKRDMLKWINIFNEELPHKISELKKYIIQNGIPNKLPPTFGIGYHNTEHHIWWKISRKELGALTIKIYREMFFSPHRIERTYHFSMHFQDLLAEIPLPNLKPVTIKVISEKLDPNLWAVQTLPAGITLIRIGKPEYGSFTQIYRKKQVKLIVKIYTYMPTEDLDKLCWWLILNRYV